MAERTVTPEMIFFELQFTTSRSSGPGGQNVNKVNTKVTVRWNVRDSAFISSEEKELLLQKLATKLTSDGELIVSSQDKRSQLDNKEDALQKLALILQKAFFKKKKRKPTKPSKSSVQSRLDKKKKHSEKKKSRQDKY